MCWTEIQIKNSRTFPPKSFETQDPLHQYCWWFRNPATQLRLVVYLPSFTAGVCFASQTVVVAFGFQPSTVTKLRNLLETCSKLAACGISTPSPLLASPSDTKTSVGEVTGSMAWLGIWTNGALWRKREGFFSTNGGAGSGWDCIQCHPIFHKIHGYPFLSKELQNTQAHCLKFIDAAPRWRLLRT